jgi:hypothetical protein
MHGNTAHNQPVSRQATQYSALSRLQVPENPCHMALRALSEKLATLSNVETLSNVKKEEPEDSPGKAISQEWIALSPRFRKNLEQFAGIALPREAATLELRVITTESLAHLQPTGSISGIGNWAILTENEARRAAPWLLNMNARHFLEYARPDRFSGTAARLETFKEFMSLNGFQRDEVVLDSSIVLEIYGLRKAGDIDYLALDVEKCSIPGIESHDGQLVHHCLSKQELINNPNWHFQIDGIRAVSFAQLKIFKRNRNTPYKDCHDVGMMEALEKEDSVALWRHRKLYKLYSIYRHSRKKGIRKLRASSFYPLARSIYRSLGGR